MEVTQRVKNIIKGMPKNSTLGILLVVFILLAVAAQINLQMTFSQVDHPVTLNEANLEADAEVVRGWYAQLTEQGTFLQMIRTELVDMLWPLALGLALVGLYRFLGGLLRKVHPAIAAFMFTWGIALALIAPVADVIENSISLAMLTDPEHFPAWWATAHAAASWVKLSGVAISAVVGIGLSLYAVATRKKIA